MRTILIWGHPFHTIFVNIVTAYCFFVCQFNSVEESKDTADTDFSFEATTSLLRDLLSNRSIYRKFLDARNKYRRDEIVFGDGNRIEYDLARILLHLLFVGGFLQFLNLFKQLLFLREEHLFFCVSFELQQVVFRHPTHLDIDLLIESTIFHVHDSCEDVFPHLSVRLINNFSVEGCLEVDQSICVGIDGRMQKIISVNIVLRLHKIIFIINIPFRYGRIHGGSVWSVRADNNRL